MGIFWQAWDTVIEQTGEYERVLNENSNTLCKKTLNKIIHLINEKKVARKFYFDERMRIDTEINKVS